MPPKLIDTSSRTPVRIWTTEIETLALNQMLAVANLPIIHPKGPCGMPDIHPGHGTTVGSVIPTVKAIIPSAIGSDIGCGMAAVQLSLKANDLPDSLGKLRAQIEQDIPLGAGGAHLPGSRWGEVAADRFNHSQDGQTPSLRSRYEAIHAKHRQVFKKNIEYQCASLGTGNHFVEICIDTKNNVWAMLHSGSRGIGGVIGQYFMEKAIGLMEQQGVEDLNNRYLSWLPEESALFDDYIEAMLFAQDYAALNRELMLEIMLSAIKKQIGKFKIVNEAISVHHNYAAKEFHFGEEVWITRKGAIRAGIGELGIVPGSMGAKSYIVRGLGNEESYCSCSHGAGRRMSREEARNSFTAKDLRQQTQGVECRKDLGVIDEAPGAYKDIDAVMANQSDLVEVVATLKQVMCVKGA